MLTVAISTDIKSNQYFRQLKLNYVRRHCSRSIVRPSLIHGRTRPLTPQPRPVQQLQLQQPYFEGAPPCNNMVRGPPPPPTKVQVGEYVQCLPVPRLFTQSDIGQIAAGPSKSLLSMWFRVRLASRWPTVPAARQLVAPRGTQASRIRGSHNTPDRAQRFSPDAERPLAPGVRAFGVSPTRAKRVVSLSSTRDLESAVR